jgi:membrane fusion protein, macrolide-specific efflux system
MTTSETIATSTHPDDVTQEVPVVPGEQTESELHGAPRRRLWSKRNLIIAAVVVALAGAGLGYWLSSGSSPTSGFQVTTEVVKVTTGTMKQTVAASGTIEPTTTADLNFGASGKVTAVNVVAGQTVTAGQVLATVDSTALQDDVNSAQSSLTSAQAKQSSDEDDGATASQIDSDEASVTSAQTQLTTAQTSLADANLTSTIAGTVASVALTVGQEVTASGNSSAASDSTGGSNGAASTGLGNTSTSDASSSSSAQVVVISTGSYMVSTTVDDSQVGLVKTGDQAVITPSNSTTPVYGTVTSVGLVASTTSDVATFPVTIAVTGSPTGLYAGSTASISIIVKQINNAIQVPTAAISYAGGSATVTAVVNGAHVSKAVTTGEVSDGYTQITKGLSSGEKVQEQVIKFPGSTGTGRSLFGGSGTTGGRTFGGGGSFGGGAPGGFTRGSGGGGFGG